MHAGSRDAFPRTEPAAGSVDNNPYHFGGMHDESPPFGIRNDPRTTQIIVTVIGASHEHACAEQSHTGAGVVALRMTAGCGE